jgi:hypothetical protein
MMLQKTAIITNKKSGKTIVGLVFTKQKFIVVSRVFNATYAKSK